MSGRYVPVGRVTGLHGVAGWVVVHSYTRLRRNIIEYSPWRLARDEDSPGSREESPPLESAHSRGNRVLAKFTGFDDRAAAAGLLRREIVVAEARFAPLPEGEYYWFQLVGLEVVNAEGRVLGVVRRLLETGANDVLVVEGAGGSHLIPYVSRDYVRAVNLEQARIEVAWEAEWQG